jgi:hypothetical protein
MKAVRETFPTKRDTGWFLTVGSEVASVVARSLLRARST